MIPYQENRCHYNFRWYFNYAGGMTGDWGVHMIDMVLLGMSRNNNIVMPRRVSSFGGKHYTGPGDDRTTPDTQIAIMEFPGGQPNSSQAVPPTGWLLQWEVHVGSQAAGNGLDGGRDHGSEFIGSEGRVLADRSGWSIFDKDGKPVEKPATQRPALDGMSRHAEEWLECVRARRQPSSDIASMHQTTTACHLANLAYLHGGAIEWDAAREFVTNDKRAMNHIAYQRPYRRPWSLPKV
jgi:predicted dehydrogenase